MDFTKYHRRSKHEGKELTYKYGVEKAQWHFILSNDGAVEVPGNHDERRESQKTP